MNSTTILSYAPARLDLIRRLKLLAWRFRKVLAVLVVIGGVYTGSYAALSATGQYEPIGGCLHGLDYAWAPHGFVHNYKWSRPAMLFYSPLWYLDANYWHPFTRGFFGGYPVHVVEDPDEVWQAWRK
jgi:hypothetical protein